MFRFEQKSIFKDILFTFLTLGLFNIWVQFRQMVDTNLILGKDEFSPLKTLVFSVWTLGAYFAYHEYTLTRTLQKLVYHDDDWTKPLWTIPATIFGLWFLVDSYQQSLINLYIERRINI
jgi:hypothetical protein